MQNNTEQALAEIEAKLCSELTASVSTAAGTPIYFAELPLSERIGYIEVSLDRTLSVEESVYVVYDHCRHTPQNADDCPPNSAWQIAKTLVKEKHPDSPWVRYGLDSKIDENGDLLHPEKIPNGDAPEATLGAVLAHSKTDGESLYVFDTVAPSGDSDISALIMLTVCIYHREKHALEEKAAPEQRLCEELNDVFNNVIFAEVPLSSLVGAVEVEFAGNNPRKNKHAFVVFDCDRRPVDDNNPNSGYPQDWRVVEDCLRQLYPDVKDINIIDWYTFISIGDLAKLIHDHSRDEIKRLLHTNLPNDYDNADIARFADMFVSECRNVFNQENLLEPKSARRQALYASRNSPSYATTLQHVIETINDAVSHGRMTCPFISSEEPAYEAVKLLLVDSGYHVVDDGDGEIVCW